MNNRNTPEIPVISSGKYFFIWGLNKIICSVHMLIRTGQIHFVQDNSVGSFGPVTSKHPAQCYSIKMSFKLIQKIN